MCDTQVHAYTRTHTLMHTLMHSWTHAYMCSCTHTSTHRHMLPHMPTDQVCAEDGHVSEGWCAKEGEPVKECASGDQRKGI